jgi:uncharacterized membrane-anchored protein YhcB (DUF1043 family)
VYGLGWLVALGLIGVVIGLAGGWFLAGRSGRYSLRVEALEAELASARRELGDYRQQVVEEFSETARKFQTLNDAYTDLHRQLAQSSSVLCGDVGAPLLKAPDGHQDLLAGEHDESLSPDEESAAADAPSEPRTRPRRKPRRTRRPLPPAAIGRPATESGRAGGCSALLVGPHGGVVRWRHRVHLIDGSVVVDGHQLEPAARR